MPSGSDFVDNVLDLLGGWGGVSARRMFGGYGLYRQGMMFALIAEDVLYFKVDDQNRAEFKAAGMGPFTYEGKSRPVEMSYYEVAAGVVRRRRGDDGLGEARLRRGAAREAAGKLRKNRRKPAARKNYEDAMQQQGRR